MSKPDTPTSKAKASRRAAPAAAKAAPPPVRGAAHSAALTEATLASADLRPMLKALGLKLHTSLARALADGQGPILVPVSDPARFLAERLAAGEAMGPAVGQWIGATNALLQAWQPERRRLVLVDDAALAAPGPAFAAEVKTWAGLDLAAQAGAPQALAGPPEPALVLADAILRADPESRALVNSWREMVLGAEAKLADGEAVARLVKGWRQQASMLAEAEGRLGRAEAELGLLRDLTGRQAELIEAAVARAAALEEAGGPASAGEGLAGEGPAEAALLTAALEALQRRLADAAQLAGQREAILAERILADGRALWAARQPPGPAPTPPADTAALSEVLALRGEVDRLRADRAALLRSTSWRLTAPLRAVRRWLGG